MHAPVCFFGRSVAQRDVAVAIAVESIYSEVKKRSHLFFCTAEVRPFALW